MIKLGIVNVKRPRFLKQLPSRVESPPKSSPRRTADRISIAFSTYLPAIVEPRRSERYHRRSILCLLLTPSCQLGEDPFPSTVGLFGWPWLCDRIIKRPQLPIASGQPLFAAPNTGRFRGKPGKILLLIFLENYFLIIVYRFVRRLAGTG